MKSVGELEIDLSTICDIPERMMCKIEVMCARDKQSILNRICCTLNAKMCSDKPCSEFIDG